MNANLLFDCQNKKESQNVDSFQKPSTPSPLYPALAARSLRGKARHRACLSSSFVNSSDCLKPSQMNWDERNCRSAGKGFRPQLSRATQALRGCLRFPTSVPHLPGLWPPSKGFQKKGHRRNVTVKRGVSWICYFPRGTRVHASSLKAVYPS